MLTQESKPLDPWAKVHIQRYRGEHLDLINSWLSKWGHAPITPRELPEHGYVAYEEQSPIASCFLRRVEGGYGVIDSLVTDPHAPSLSRHIAIELLTKALIDDARAQGLHHLVAVSEDISTIERSAKYGFKKRNHAVLSLDLNEKEV